LAALERELADLKERATAVRARWEHELEELNTVGKLQEELDATRVELEHAQRAFDWERAAERQYRVTQLEQQARAAIRAREEARGSRERLVKEEVDEEDIAAVVSRWTGIPVARLLRGEVEKLVHMEERLRERVVGQDDALVAVANAVRTARAGLHDPKRPLGSFLFLGPTGVGKTETARALAEFLFDDPRALVRIDMSEYQEKHTVSRLIGAPPGYVGYEEAGQLTEAVRRRPYSVVLFDEVEKAHPEVLNVLLQLLDDGRLTDGQGRTVDFRNTIVIMTSNLGSEYITERGLPWDEIQRRVLEVVRGSVRPELLNRIDEVIVFRPLDLERITAIVDIQLGDLRERLRDRRITLELTPRAKEALAAEGFDPIYGARPLRRVIQRRIVQPLALRLLAGDFSDGTHVVVDDGDGQFVFRSGETSASVEGDGTGRKGAVGSTGAAAGA
jgi:ATP-dependent Clp protease ATP-binding subunit ClpB